LLRQGFDVRIIGAADQGLPATLEPGELIESKLLLVPWWDVNAPLNVLAGGRQSLTRIGDAAVSPSLTGRILLAAKHFYQSVFHFPDGQVGWVRSAITRGVRLSKKWRPDLIFGSALPASSLYASRAIAREVGVPWVAEFRDLWAESHYYSLPHWRRVLDRLLEQRLLKSASAVVTVSNTLAGQLRQRTSVPVEVIFNGIDDVPRELHARASVRSPTLEIVHTGQLIPGKRDPRPLLEALAMLGEIAADINVRFFGRRLDVVTQEMRELPSRARVSVHDPVSRQSAVQIQGEADLLLLLLWNHPSERGVVTSKLFEYLGAQRQILVVGPADGEAASIVKECEAGYVGTDPLEIASILKIVLELKRSDGIPRPPIEKAERYRRSVQVAKLGQLFHRISRGY
jgi:hypothetical protein